MFCHQFSSGQRYSLLPTLLSILFCIMLPISDVNVRKFFSVVQGTLEGMEQVQKPLQEEVTVNSHICLSLPDDYLNSEVCHTLDFVYAIPGHIGHYVIVLHARGGGEKAKYVFLIPADKILLTSLLCLSKVWTI